MALAGDMRLLDDRMLEHIARELKDKLEVTPDEVIATIAVNSMMQSMLNQLVLENHSVISLLDKTLGDESKDLVARQQMREKIVNAIEHRFDTELDYPRTSSLDYGMIEKGIMVRRKGSISGTAPGRVNTDFGEARLDSEGAWASVSFPGFFGKRINQWCRRKDLEIAWGWVSGEERIRLEANKKRIIERACSQTLGQFLKDIEGQVAEIAKRDDPPVNELAHFEPGDRVVYVGADLRRTKSGSEGTIVRNDGWSYEVVFESPTWEADSKIERTWISPRHLERLSVKKIAERMGGPEKFAKDVVRGALVEVFLKADRDIIGGAAGDAKELLVGRLIKELVDDGFLVDLGKQEYGVVLENNRLADLGRHMYGVNINRTFYVLAGPLAEAYNNPQLYSSPDMFSPPAERKPHVLRLELTQGCNYNACTYCDGYKGIRYRERTFQEFLAHFGEVRNAIGTHTTNIRRVFLGGGNALDAAYDTLLNVVSFVNAQLSPRRIAIYGTTDAILKQGREKLANLNRSGLKLIYWGLETGCQKLHDYVHTGENVKEMVLAGGVARSAGLDLSVMVMPGLGGVRYSDAHILETAILLDAIDAKFVTFMTVNPSQNSAYSRIMAQEMADGKNRPLTEMEVVDQLRRTLKLMKPKYQKVGIFSPGIDQVGKNPVRFNVVFNLAGKEQALGICDRRLQKAKA